MTFRLKVEVIRAGHGAPDYDVLECELYREETPIGRGIWINEPVSVSPGGVIQSGKDAIVVCHRAVSREHAILNIRNGRLYYTDKSTGGSFYGEPKTRIPNNVPRELTAGDRVYLTEYCMITVRAEDETITQKRPVPDI